MSVLPYFWSLKLRQEHRSIQVRGKGAGTGSWKPTSPGPSQKAAKFWQKSYIEQSSGAESSIREGEECEKMLLDAHNLHVACQKTSFLCMLPARQAESHGQASRPCAKGQVILNQRQTDLQGMPGECG